MECIVCAKNKFENLLEIKNSPLSVQKLNEKKRTSLETIDINLIRCASCGMIQLSKEDYPKEEYYEDYLMTTSGFNKHQTYTDWFSDLLIKKYDLKNKVVLDVGSGDGYFVENMKKKNINAFGIEPSKTFFEESKKRDIHVINGYLNKESQISKNYLDGFVSRQVFEHLINPKEVLDALKMFLKPGGLGFIEVPSFEKSIKDLRYYDIFRDHVAYYTKKTLSYLIKQGGYELIEIKDVFDFEYLLAIFRKKIDTSYFVSSYLENKRRFNEYLGQISGDIVIWGAGGKGNTFLSMYELPTNKQIYVVDSDPHKVGKFTPGSNHKIFAPDLINTKKIDAVIITAMAYSDEIIKELKDKYNYKQSIYIISPTIKKVR